MPVFTSEELSKPPMRSCRRPSTTTCPNSNVPSARWPKPSPRTTSPARTLQAKAYRAKKPCQARNRQRIRRLSPDARSCLSESATRVSTLRQAGSSLAKRHVGSAPCFPHNGLLLGAEGCLGRIVWFFHTCRGCDDIHFGSPLLGRHQAFVLTVWSESLSWLGPASSCHAQGTCRSWLCL